ncbi:D-2-hydroxyacid dehydrogenase [Paenibacillus sp. WQ 127069]|uniref:D-2-hydroxyacid dehydrogenase n=1 Tax=Paenibacillus baimaensis TaxID=2982185 RepID=A0ABT2UPH2_9BACL|nr:D-2-hydroxyacid dehydrogenase [Paenibacillus sp. WQ 127069]MCU6796549.1 D-2-hydroxyacid dehydrogenase [Paenibacillus sp. WQ 127069]
MTSTREIKNVLVTVEYAENHMARLKEALSPANIIHLSTKDASGIEEALKIADVALLHGDLDDRFLNAPNLRWIHCDHAGLNKSARPEVFEKGIIVTSSAGRSGPVLAEHVMYFSLALTYRFTSFYAAQQAHQWGIPGQNNLRGLYGKTMGILGLGNTGKELALRAKAFNMRVLGYRRSLSEIPEHVDKLFCADRGDTLDELLRESDIVALVLPLSNETHHLIGKRELELMKPSAFLVNLARGAVVDENALLLALREGTIAGAGLDTFSSEPLSADSPLWDAPNTLITPHCTPAVPDRNGRSLEFIRHNIHAYRTGGVMVNQLSERDIYTKG